MKSPKTTAPNAGGARQFPIRVRWTARVGEFCLAIMKSHGPTLVLRLGTLAGRWILAIIVAWFAANATYIASLSVPILIGMFSSSQGGRVEDGAFLVGYALTGTVGVLAGTMCLGVRSRRFGSVILLLLGISYHYYFSARMIALRSDVTHPPYTRSAALAVGGALVVAWFMIRKPANKPAADNSRRADQLTDL